ncbi:MAG: 50S ribosomal protein L30 [Flavobacteriales bacterium]|nr:50S ribosomal protein L30 [Flavobacteriales bacterium]
MAQIKITQTKSRIKQLKSHKLTLNALGLKKLNRPVIKESNDAILGMVAKVKHMVTVEEVK